MNDIIKDKLALLPDKPGCYQMKDNKGTVIYVGKAKNLKNRVRSYFVGAHNIKTTNLVNEICDLDYIITSSNKESFILELNLIKRYNPKYNILLKDDKTYPYIALTNELHPRLYVTRNTKNKNIKYFGPYPSVKSAKNTCELLNNIYPLRKCINIPNKSCLYYHLKQCLAPCINKENIIYDGYLKQIKAFLNGNAKSILDALEDKMNTYSRNLDFEKAIEYRNLINDITETIDKQKITLSTSLSADFIGLSYDDIDLAIHILIMRNGKIIGSEKEILPIYTDLEDVITSYLLQYYNDVTPKEVYINNLEDINLLEEVLDVKIKVPQKGHKFELLQMANTNAYKDLHNKKYIYENRALKRSNTLSDFAALLDINIPNYIEAFDNSNLYGEYPISAMVVYRNGLPSKHEYRKYHIKTVKGPNDYESMKEVVYRRYFRLLMENKELPDLIIMDGGQIQVNACKEVINKLNLNIPVCGIQKDDYHKAALIYFEDKKIKVDKNSDIYLFIANISQTVHDFAIRFFRSEHVKGIYSSKLDNIMGLGKKRKELLLKEFIKIDNIKTASIEDLNALGIPKDVCKRILETLNRGDKVDN